MESDKSNKKNNSNDDQVNKDFKEESDTNNDENALNLPTPPNDVEISKSNNNLFHININSDISVLTDFSDNSITEENDSSTGNSNSNNNQIVESINLPNGSDETNQNNQQGNSETFNKNSENASSQMDGDNNYRKQELHYKNDIINTNKNSLTSTQKETAKDDNQDQNKIQPENTLTLQTNSDNKRQLTDKINDNKDQNRTESESQNPENIIVKVDNTNIDCKPKTKTADDIIGHHKDQSNNTSNPPIGLPNLSDNCYLNSVLQTLFSCQNFQDEIIEIYQKYKSINCNNINKEFVVTLGKLFFHMKENNGKEITNTIKGFYQYYKNSQHGNDISECFLEILSRISSESPQKISSNRHECFQHNNENTKNNESTTAQFSGQILLQGKCSSCQQLLFQDIQLFRSIPIKIPISESQLSITTCIESYFDESKLNDTDFKCCKTPEIIFISKIQHSPQYIFIILVRDSYNLSEIKSKTFIEFDNYIIIPTENRNVLYKLRSVIDYIDNDGSGHFLVKTVSRSNWYLINDTKVKQINPTDVPTNYSIGLLIEKVTNFDENIPEPLIDYDPNCFHQNGFQSIIQMLYQCCDIRQYFIDIYTINISNKNKTQKLNFKETLGQMFYFIRNMNEQEIMKGVKDLYEIFGNFIEKNDIFNCYIQIVNKINDAIKSAQINQSEPNNVTNVSVNDQVLIYKNEKDKLISDNFYGQISFETKCDNKECNKMFFKSNQSFSMVPLYIQSMKQNTPISECIEKHFEKSKVEGSNYQCCDKQVIITIPQCTLSPRFLFIYLVRGKSERTFIEFDNYINIPTVNGNVLYKLRSVIDRSNDYNSSGRYLVKMLIDSTWWLKKYHRMKKVIPKIIPTNLSVGLLFEKVTNINHNIPEPLLIDKYDNNYQKDLESIIKFLYLCCDIRKHLIDFYTNENTNENITGNLIFKRKIGEMMSLLDKNETDKIQKLPKETLNFLPTKIPNIDQLYYCILDKLNDQTTNNNEDTKQQSTMAKSDLFVDQISIDLKCKLCDKIFQEGIRTFKSIIIYEPTSQQNVTISECLENYLDKSENNECNDKQQIISINQLTNSPQFIFIYLVRKSNKLIEFNNYINVPTVNGNVLYKLRYVIDQIGDNESKRYVVKTLSDSKWLEKSDDYLKMLDSKDVPSLYSIGFLIEKVTNINHNVPETLLNDNYSCQEALQSIIQMLNLCVNIRKCLIEFYANDHSNENITENLIFKTKIGEIMYFLENENESGRINKLFAEASNFLPNRINDIHQLYLCVMNKLNEKITQINSNTEYEDSIDECGYKRSRNYCENCNNYSVEISQTQIFKSLYLKSENNNLNLSKRIEKFYKSQLNDMNDIEKCCKNPKIVFVEEILSAPKYLFIYLHRIDGNVEDNKEIILNTQSGTRRYCLNSLLNYNIDIRKFLVRKFESKSIPKPKNESIIAVMMVREDENNSVSNSASYKRCEIDMKTKESFDSKPDLHDNLNNQHNSHHEFYYRSNISNTIYDGEKCEMDFAEEKLKSDFIAQSIKQIIELNKDNKIHVLLGLLFSCTSFRNFMINLYNDNEIKKEFDKFALIDIGIFVNNVCSLYDHVIKQKTINPIIESDKKRSIQQCFNYILGHIKLITESEEFSKSIKPGNRYSFNFISDNFCGKFLLEVFCIKCSRTMNFEDSFNYLCVKKPQNESSINLETCLINNMFDGNYQHEKKCCENAEFVLTRKINHAPPILFICVDEKTRNINRNCILYCDSTLLIDTTNGQVTYALVSLVDWNAGNKYNVKFLGNSDWWQTYPKSGKINISEHFSTFTVGFLFKQLK